MNAFNIWALFDLSPRQPGTTFRLDSAHWLGPSLHAWGFVLLGTLIAALTAYPLLVGVSDCVAQRARVIVSIAAALTFAFFLVLTRMHERHLLPVLPLLALLCTVARRYWPVYAVLSRDYILNLQFAYPSVAYFPIPSFVTANAEPRAMSLVNVCAFTACLALLATIARRGPTSGRTARRHTP